MRRLFLAVLLVSIVTLPLSIARAETWTVVCEDNFPPYNFIRDGEKTGLDTDIVRAVLAQIGVDENLQVYPWSRALGMLENGSADLLYQVVDTPERRARFILVGPLRRGRTVLAVRAGESFAPRGIDGLKGHSVGVVRAFRYTAEFDDAALDRVVANDNQTLVRMLVGQHVDVIVGDYNTLTFIAQQQGVADRIRLLPTPLGEVARYVALPKDRAEKAERFRRGLETIRANGTLDQILKHWE